MVIRALQRQRCIKSYIGRFHYASIQPWDVIEIVIEDLIDIITDLAEDTVVTLRTD